MAYSISDGDARSSDPDESQSEEEQELAQDSPSNRRRLRNAQFEAILTQRALQGPSTNDTPRKTVKINDDLSIARLAAQQDSNGGNLDPRAYQIELFERAKSRNTIAVLDTGSGKTLIAVLLVKHILQCELVDRASGKAPRVAFFLVNSVTLVFQQSAVLRNNLDQNVAHIFGAMGPDFWDQGAWNAYFTKNMVIVCTAEILNHALLNGFMKISQINLLIFDEAHHTKKDHPYASIIRNAYFKADQSERPRIFGMTASPIDAKVNVAKAARHLELLLDSEIATTSHLNLLRQIVRTPSEETWVYRKLDEPFTTELYQTMHQKFGHIKALAPVFRFSLYATSELGKWCADQIWVQALADEVLPKLEGIVFRDCGEEFQDMTPEEAEHDITKVREAYEIVRAHKHENPRASGQLSPKVELFRAMLTKHFLESTDKKCIVFTQRRNTAKALLRLCEVLGIPNLRPGILVGLRNSDITGSITFRHQFLALVKFRQDEINCLFATSVAEEGLDIPDCNLVVRFDLCNTVIQYVQSRGRARHAHSTYASMIEKGNETHKKRLQELREVESLMQAFCKSLPEDRILRGDDFELDAVLNKKEAGRRVYEIESTGAKLTYAHAINILTRYASSLQYENELSTQVHYVIFRVGRSFACEVILPEKSPIRGVIGGPASNKIIAKQSAAFDTCLLLRKNTLLDDHFRSIYQKRLPAMRNAKLAIVSRATNNYAMICKPSMWAKPQDTIPSVLYATVISFKPSQPLKRHHHSLLLLTREQLPSIPPFPIYLDDGIETIVEAAFLGNSIPVTRKDLEGLSNFTLAVFHDVFHKTFDPEPKRFPYWIAPIRQEMKSLSPSEVIDWATVASVEEKNDWRWSAGMDNDLLLDRFLYDPLDGTKRYFPIAVEDNLRPSDQPPSYAPRRKWMDNIMGYSLSLSNNSRPRFLNHCDWNQPVLQVECVCLRRNFLDRPSEAQKEENVKSVVCPEPLVISAIPLTTITSCLAFPAIVSRIESYLIVLEGCHSLGLNIKAEYALEAFTKHSDNTEEHRALQIHVQRGMGKNYERLEFLGDGFLKMATSISLFCQKPDDDEYDYHVNRMCLICNRNLFNAATKIGLFQYIRSRGFSRHGWYPLGLTLLHGRNYVKHRASESTHALAEKTIADVCEALIAASLLSGGGNHRFDMAVKAVTLFVDNENHTATSWADYLASYSKPAYQTQASDPVDADLSNKIFDRLGYRFRYPRLLRSAFKHPSHPSSWVKVPCYQRLEFLGDALLDMVCIEYLFHRFQDKDPQWLTEHKMAMVSNRFLGALAVKVGLHRQLQYFGSTLQSQITHYAEAIQMSEDKSNGAMDYWLSVEEAPKCLPDMLEAYIAAIFVDSEFDFTVIEQFFNAHVKPYFEDMSLYDTFANRHPNTFLRNQLVNVYGCIDCKVLSGDIPSADDDGKPMILAAAMVHGQPLGEAIGTSGRYAKIRACHKALEAIDGMSVADFRVKYHCNCQASESKDLKDMDIGTAI